MKPKTSSQQFHPVFTTIILLVCCLSLAGCISIGKDSRQNLDYEQMQEMQMQSQYSAVPDDKAIKDALPEMRAHDFEKLGDGYLSKGHPHQAFVQFEKALQLDPQNSVIQYKKGLAFLGGRLSQDAIREFEKVLEKKPGFAPALLGMGQAYFQLKNYDISQQYCRRALEIDSSLWRAHNFIGMAYDYQNKPDWAIKSYSQAIFLNPHEGSLYNNLGISYMLTADYSKAARAFLKALESGYRIKKVYNNLGLALSQSGEYDRALEAFKKGGNLPIAYNNLGCVLLSQGKSHEATRYFEKAIAVDPAFYVKAHDNLKRAKIGFLQKQ
jgi:tetratricopeptide (TPR) repeat protein